MNKSRKLIRAIEITLLAVGLLLVGTYAAATLHRSVSSSNAVRDFDRTKVESKAVEPKPPRDLATPQVVDFTLWSDKRVREYHQTLSQPFKGPMAVLSVPKFNIRVPVVEGTDDWALNRGVGWIAGTARPGEHGNVGIAGHRDGFFRPLKDIRQGDEMGLETLDGLVQYKVDKIEIVTPDNVTVLQPRQADSITLVTCYPFYFVGDAPRRFIVHASRQ
jgi:sortase A